MTINGGGQWTNVAANIKGVSAGSPVSALETSHRNADVVYAAFDRHMFDDMHPFLFQDGRRRQDLGQHNRRASRATLSFGWYGKISGTRKFSIWAPKWARSSHSTRRPLSRFNLKNLPNVAVRDIFLQADRNDILLATHGRGLYILDDATPIQQIAGTLRGKLFPIRSALRYSLRATRAGGGDSEFAAANPPYGAILNYYLPGQADEFDLKFRMGRAKLSARSGARETSEMQAYTEFPGICEPILL